MMSRSTKKILIYGSQEFGKVIRNLAGKCGYEFAGYIDDYHSGGEIIGCFEEVKHQFSPEEIFIAVAVGYNNLRARWDVYEKVKGSGYHLPKLIHPLSYVDDCQKVGEGSFIMAMAAVDFNAKIGDMVVVWPGTVVNHDSIIRSNTFLSPNSTVCGFVVVGRNCFVGAGSVIVDHLNVPDNTFIKAGSLYSPKSMRPIQL